MDIFEGKDFKIIEGNCLDSLEQLPDNSVHCVVTSPPYWGVRFYGTEPQIWGGFPLCKHQWVKQKSRRPRSENDVTDPDSIQNKNSNCNLQETELCSICKAYRGELGQENNPELFIEHLVSVFKEVRRVLHPTGICYVNIGYTWNNNSNVEHPYLKEKDIVPIPEMFAIAMQKSGWYWRTTNIWHKLNCSPYSGKDRSTMNYEYIYMFTKNSTYYYDQESIREDKKEENYTYQDTFESVLETESVEDINTVGANRRAVWTLGTSKDRTGHAAPFCEDLPKICIASATSEKGVCAECGFQYERNIEKKRIHRHELNPSDPRYRPKRYESKHDELNGSAQSYVSIKQNGWKKTCKCITDKIKPAIVLDIFNGSGSTGAVALKMNRRYIGLELLPEYVELTKKRFQGSEDSLFNMMEVL